MFVKENRRSTTKITDSSSGYSTAASLSSIRTKTKQRQKSPKGFHQWLTKLKNFIRTPRSQSTDPKKKSSQKTNFHAVQSWLNDNFTQTIDDQTSFSTMATIKQSSYLTRTPRRSSSMVGRDFSPASSLSSLILSPTKKTPTVDKSSRRRIIDFNRRRTVTGPIEQISSNKENLTNSSRISDIYRFTPTTSEESSTKKYFFYTNNNNKNDSQHRTLPIGKNRRNSFSSMINTSQVPSLSSSVRLANKSIPQRTSIDSLRTSHVYSESLEDLLCDKEVESYFYPSETLSKSRIPDNIYIHLTTANDHYKKSGFVQGTLC